MYKNLAEIKSFMHDLIHLSHRRVTFSISGKILYIGCDCGKIFYDRRNPEEIELSKELIDNVDNLMKWARDKINKIFIGDDLWKV